MNFHPIIPWYILLLLGFSLIGFTIFAASQRPKTRTRWMRRSIVILFFILATMCPTIGEQPISNSQLALDVYFVVDVTPSMGALDYGNAQQRIDGAKSDLTTVIKNIGYAYYSLITFNSNADLALPLESDPNTAITAVNSMIPGVANISAGSNLSVPLATIKKRLTADHQSHPDRKQVLIYVSDGEQNTQSPPSLSAFSAIKSLINGGYVFGYGTQAGAKMINQSYDASLPTFGTDNTPYIENNTDNSGQIYISHFDPNTLESIAGYLGVNFDHRSSADGLDSVANQLRTGARSDSGDSKKTTGFELYWIFILPVFLLILREAWDFIPKLQVFSHSSEVKND